LIKKGQWSAYAHIKGQLLYSLVRKDAECAYMRKNAECAYKYMTLSSHSE